MLQVAFALLLIYRPTSHVDLSKLAPEASDAIRTQQERATTEASDWHQLGILYHAHGLENDAIEAYRYSLDLSPNPKASYLLAVALARTGVYEKAIQVAANVDNYLPALWQQGYWYLDLGKSDKAAQQFTAAIKVDKNCVAAIIGLARVHLSTNEPQKAITVLEDIVARGGEHPYLTFLLGTAHRRASNHSIASKLLAAPVNGPPKWDDPWVTEMLSHTKGYAADLARATACIDSGNPSEALKKFGSLAKRYPKDPAVLNNYATLYLKLGQLNKAEDILKQSIRWSPTYAPSQLTMAFIMQTSGKLDIAIAYAKKAIEYQPAMSDAHSLVGELSFQSGDMQNAEKYFAKAIELGDSDILIREMYGMVLLNLGKTTQALHQFNLVLQISKKRTPSISGKAIATALLGNPDAALQILAQAKTNYPNDSSLERAWQSVLQIKGRQ